MKTVGPMNKREKQKIQSCGTHIKVLATISGLRILIPVSRRHLLGLLVLIFILVGLRSDPGSGSTIVPAAAAAARLVLDKLALDARPRVSELLAALVADRLCELEVLALLAVLVERQGAAVARLGKRRQAGHSA